MSVTGNDDFLADAPTPPSGFPAPQLPADQVATIQPAGAPGPWAPPGGPGTGPFPQPSEPPPPRPRRSYRKVWLTLLSAVLAVVLLAVGYTVVRYLVDSSTYDDGHQAYQRADCAAAVTEFDSVISAWRLVKLGDRVARAESEKAECLAFQEGASRQQAGDNPAAIAAFAKFVPGRPQSPLTDAARGRVITLFEQPEMAKLATKDSCDALQVLRDEKLLGPAAPGFHAACGATYNKAGDKFTALATYSRLFADYGKDKAATDAEAEMIKDTGWCHVLDKVRSDQVLAARQDLLPGLLSTCAAAMVPTIDDGIEMAQEFLQKYPGHRFTPDVLATYAQLLNRLARNDSDADALGAPEVIRSVRGDKAVILVHNDSTKPLRIALSGPEPRIEDIEPCPDCPDVEDHGPFCRDQATMKRIELAPGEYDIAVDSPDGSVTARGHSHWVLQPGKEYFSCYSLGRGDE